MRSCDPSIKRSRFIRGLPPTPRVGPMRWPASENAFRLACCSTDIHFCQMEAESTCPERHSIDTVGTRVTCRRIEIYTSKSSSSSRLVRTSPCPLLVVMTLPCPLRFKRRRRLDSPPGLTQDPSLLEEPMRRLWLFPPTKTTTPMSEVSHRTIVQSSKYRETLTLHQQP
jgi:hypothetical protein